LSKPRSGQYTNLAILANNVTDHHYGKQCDRPSLQNNSPSCVTTEKIFIFAHQESDFFLQTTLIKIQKQ